MAALLWDGPICSGSKQRLPAPRDRPALRLGDVGLAAGAPACHYGVARQRHREAIAMTATGPETTSRPIVPSTDIALIIYILYFVGYFNGITKVIGVIMAHIQLDTADPMLATHYRFQIRTFWIGLLYVVVGAVLSLIVIGVAVLVWWFIWSLIRNIKGVLALNERRPIADPTSWLFG
jgi:uncharacterized membrane protein